MHLDEQEIEIALVALEYFEASAAQQIRLGSADGCTAAAWHSARYCHAKAQALIERIKERKKDNEEEKNDA